jgi:hypothetical protein
MLGDSEWAIAKGVWVQGASYRDQLDQWSCQREKGGLREDTHRNRECKASRRGKSDLDTGI